jgi:hypothetical protein
VNCEVILNVVYGGQQGGGVEIHDEASAKFVNCSISGNDRWGTLPGTLTGGGVWHVSNGAAEFVGCMIGGNTAPYGGGIYAERGTVICRDCVFTRNSASWGASIHATQDASVTLVNCRFTKNSLFLFDWVQCWDIYTEGLNCVMINCTLADVQGSSDAADVGGTIRNCILRGPRFLLGGDVSYSNAQGYRGPGLMNIDVEPQFVDAAGDDYRLLPSSACIDMGTSFEAPDHDLDGNTRPVDIPGKGFEGPGEGFDMGCYEFTPLKEDLNMDGEVNEKDLFIFSRQWQRGR